MSAKKKDAAYWRLQIAGLKAMLVHLGPDKESDRASGLALYGNLVEARLKLRAARKREQKAKAE